MDTEALRELSRALNAFCLPPAILFPIIYGLQTRWYASNVGRSLMSLSTMLAVLFTLTFIRTVWPTWGNDFVWVWIGIAFFGGSAVALWYFFISALNLYSGESGE